MAFENLEQETIRELIPLSGPRTIFTVRFKEYLNALKVNNNNINEKDTTEDIVPESVDESVEVISVSQAALDQLTKISQELKEADIEITEAHVKRALEEETAGPSKRLAKSTNSIQTYDLAGLLKNHVRGKVILSTHATHGDLNNAERNKLAQIIIATEISDDLAKRLPGGRFTFLAKEIVKTFPKEVTVTWEHVHKYPNGKKIGKGKLYNAYYNARRQLRSAGLLDDGHSRFEEGDPDDTFDEVDGDSADLTDALQWLKNCKSPWERVIELWKKTSKHRISDVKSKNLPVHKYTEQFPCLRDPLGHTLIDIDFEQLYPAASLKLYSEWEKFSKYVVDALQAKEKVPLFDETITPEEKTCLILKNICRLFPVVTAVKGNKNKTQWRPSRVENEEGFFLELPTIAAFQPTLAARREKLAKFGLTFQPQLLTIKPSAQGGSRKYYVVIDSLLYEVESLLKALDVTFKRFFALHASFPPEAEQIWLFIELAVYEVKTKWDKHFVNVQRLVTEYKKK